MGLLLKLLVWSLLPPSLLLCAEHGSQQQPYSFISPQPLISHSSPTCWKQELKNPIVCCPGAAARRCSGCGRDGENYPVSKLKSIEIINQCIRCFIGGGWDGAVTRYSPVWHKGGIQLPVSTSVTSQFHLTCLLLLPINYSWRQTLWDTGERWKGSVFLVMSLRWFV